MKITHRKAGTSRSEKAKSLQGLGLRLMWTMSALFGRVGKAGALEAGKASMPKSAKNLALSA